MAYFDMLTARADLRAAYHLRTEAQVDQYRSNATPIEAQYIYPNDPDPRKQDAMKITIAGNSLRTQVWVPTNHLAHTNLFVTWDCWYGDEFLVANTSIATYKAWNLCSPNSAIWTELQARFGLASNVPGAVAMTGIRQYGGFGPNAITMGGVAVPPGAPPHNYGNDTIGPMEIEYGVARETWTRHWLFMAYVPPWYQMSLWMADFTQGVVQVLGGIQINPRLSGVSGATIDGKWDILRVEYNTSTATVVGNRPLVGYARNIVTLGGTPASQVPALLIKPNASGQ
jgi:hypothetical protein